MGVVAAVVVSLAAHHAPVPTSHGPGAARFYILANLPATSPHTGVYSRLAADLPHAMQVCGRNEAAAVVSELYDEVQERMQSSAPEASSRYLVIHDLARFRELKRDEDDFGLGLSRSGTDAGPSVPRKLAAIIQDGPAVGVHVVMWCDSLNNLNRWLDRATLRDVEMRVLFQMNAADSSHLVDSPVASKLGLYRALFADEAEGRLEKFRPYRIPPAEWLHSIKEILCRPWQEAAT